MEQMFVLDFRLCLYKNHWRLKRVTPYSEINKKVDIFSPFVGFDSLKNGTWGESSKGSFDYLSTVHLRDQKYWYLIFGFFVSAICLLPSRIFLSPRAFFHALLWKETPKGGWASLRIFSSTCFHRQRSPIYRFSRIWRKTGKEKVKIVARKDAIFGVFRRTYIGNVMTHRSLIFSRSNISCRIKLEWRTIEYVLRVVKQWRFALFRVTNFGPREFISNGRKKYSSNRK